MRRLAVALRVRTVHLLHPGALRVAARLAWLAVLAPLGDPPALLAQETRILPPEDLVPLHSTVDVSTLPAPSLAIPPDLATVEVKPFLTPDPEGLRQWREFLDQQPEALPPAPGFTEDLEPETAAPAPLAPAVSVQFEGLANSDNITLTGFSIVPPDDNLGVGPSHVFEMVNRVGRISDKSGTAISSFTLNSFFLVDSGFRAFDPRVIYDAISGRWFAVLAQSSSSLGTSSLILAVSTTSNPTGTFCRYRIGNATAETFVQDFPMLGVSDDKVVVSYNGFTFSDTFVGAGYYVLNKADLTACASTVRRSRAPPDVTKGTPHPAQSLGSTSVLHLAMHLLGTSTLRLLTVGGVPGVSMVTETSTPLGIRSWTDPPVALQAGSSVTLDTGDSRVLSVAWQNQSLWVAGNEACTPAGDSVPRSCLRLIEVRTNPPSIRQDLTFGASGAYFYYPALRPDSADNVHVVFTRSSASTAASVRVTGRLATDPLNTLQASAEIRAGGGAQTDVDGRMGDYSGAAVDPSDPRFVWVSGEYVRVTGDRDWGTWIARLTFAAPPSVTLTVTRAGTGSGTVTSSPAGISCGATCSAAFGSGTAVTLTATAAAGSAFAGWSGGGCSGTGTCTVTLTAATTVTATFVVASTGGSPLVAAVLPSSRSVQVGTPATAFATIINSGPGLATACGPALLTSVPASFSFQTTDPATNQLTGTPDTPVDIPAGAAQSFVVALTPTSAIAPTDLQFSFDCANTAPAAVLSGINTLLFSASATPVPDIVALAATPTNDGIVNLPGPTGTGVFAVATVNLGASDAITVSADTGGASLPVTLALCETNPATGQCLSPIGPSVTTPINAGATPAFGIFVTGTGTVPFDPATARIFVRFRDAGGVIRGATSVAVRTQ